jgi:hypothetical protein
MICWKGQIVQVLQKGSRGCIMNLAISEIYESTHLAEVLPFLRFQHLLNQLKKGVFPFAVHDIVHGGTTFD